MTFTTSRSEVEVVVTGASGFIGQAVCRELVARGIRVYGVSRRADFALPGVEGVYAGDYAGLRVPREAFCIHLAGTSNVQAVQADPEGETEEALRIAQALVRHGFPRILFASSAVVYGDNIMKPRREDEPVAPLTPYGQMKYAVEQVLLEHGQTVARLGNVYGEDMPANLVIPEIIAQLSTHGDIVVRDSAAVRDYVHISDVARGMVDLVLSRVRGILNLGTGCGTSVQELATLISHLAGQQRRIISKTASSSPPSVIILDPTKMYNEIGWRAHLLLEEGLRLLLKVRVNAQESIHR